jgi:integrase
MGGRCVRTRKPYPYVHEITDRHGHRRAYFRKRGHPSVALPLPIGSRAFVEAYQAAIEGAPQPVSGRTKPGTIAALVEHYYASRLWTELSPQSQRTYRHILDHFVREHGHRLVKQMEAKHVEAIIGSKASTPTAANKLRKLLGLLMRVAILNGYRKDNPVTAVKGIKIKSKGHRTWTDEEIAAFEAHFPIGTEARLAFALLLWTGQRRGDVVRMGPDHVRDGIITITQQKTGEVVDIPILPALQFVLGNVQRRRITPTFIVTEYGQAFSEAGFTNKFRDWCKAAGLPRGLSPHGLRKAFCCVSAEAGLTPHQIMSISGHRTLTEVTRYTAAVNRKKLAIEGMRMIETRTGSGNPDQKVSTREA